MAAPALPKIPEQLSFQDYLGLNAALFEWAESYDSKDWDRLSHCCTPTLHIDYTSFLSYHAPALPQSEYLSMISSTTVLGSPLLKTQHFIGASRWEYLGEGKAVGYHQLRVPHQKYLGDGNGGLGEVDFKGHAHGSNVHWYEKTGGMWKFAGLKPEIRWGEFDFERVFETGRGEHGTEKTTEEGLVDGDAEGATTEKAQKVEAGKIMGGIDASTATTTDGSSKDQRGHVDSPEQQQQQQQQTAPVATAPAPAPTQPGAKDPDVTSSSSSYQATLIQEKKDQLYETAEAAAAAEEVQIYAGAMADGLDHLGAVGHAQGKEIETTA